MFNKRFIISMYLISLGKPLFSRFRELFLNLAALAINPRYFSNISIKSSGVRFSSESGIPAYKAANLEHT